MKTAINGWSWITTCHTQYITLVQLLSIIRWHNVTKLGVKLISSPNSKWKVLFKPKPVKHVLWEARFFLPKPLKRFFLEDLKTACPEGYFSTKTAQIYLQKHYDRTKSGLWGSWVLYLKIKAYKQWVFTSKLLRYKEPKASAMSVDGWRSEFWID